MSLKLPGTFVSSEELAAARDQLARVVQQPPSDELAWMLAIGHNETDGLSALNHDPRDTPWRATLEDRRPADPPRLVFISTNVSWSFYTDGPGKEIFATLLAKYGVGREHVSFARLPRNFWNAFFGEKAFFSRGSLPCALATSGEMRIDPEQGGLTVNCTEALQRIAENWKVPFELLKPQG